MKRTALTFIAIIALSVSAVFIQDENAEAASRFRGADLPQAPQIKPTPRPELKLLWLSGVTLSKTTTIAGAVDGDIFGTVRLLRPAVSNGITVDLSLNGLFHVEAGIPVSLESGSVTIPSGQESANFRIRTFTLSGYNYPLQYTVKAKYGDETRTANFTLQALTISSLAFIPPAGFGPFVASGVLTLNARPAASRTVTLTSSNPNVVGLGSIGNASISLSFTGSADNSLVDFTSAGSNSVKNFWIVTSRVSQNTTVTVTATMNGRVVSRQVTVRAP